MDSETSEAKFALEIEVKTVNKTKTTPLPKGKKTRKQRKLLELERDRESDSETDTKKEIGVIITNTEKSQSDSELESGNLNSVTDLVQYQNQTNEKEKTQNFNSKSNGKSKNSRDRHFVNRSTRSMYSLDGFEERHDLEQYFWTQKTIDGILSAVNLTFDYDPEEDCCCLCTPSLAHNWWVADESKEVSLLDIDTRFKYLPKFRYFDLRDPSGSNLTNGTNSDSTNSSSGWRLIIFDPPFFYIPMQVLYEAVLHICGGNIKSTKLLLGFLKREEKILVETFKDFNLKRTNFPLEYAHVKSNKWVNYAMYSNVDLPGIKRIQATSSK